VPDQLIRGGDLLDRFDVEFRQSEGEVELVRHNFGKGPYLGLGAEEGKAADLLEPYNDMAGG